MQLRQMCSRPVFALIVAVAVAFSTVQPAMALGGLPGGLGGGFGGGKDGGAKGGGDAIALPGGESGDVQAEEVVIRAEAQHAEVPRGSRTAIAVVLSHKTGWKTWPAAELDALPEEIASFTIPTSVVIGTPRVENGPSYAGPEAPVPAWIDLVAGTQWPEVYDIVNPLGGEPEMLKGFSGEAVVFLSFSVSADAPLGDAMVPVGYAYQACDDSTCLRPESGVLNVPITIVAVDAGAAVNESAVSLFEAYSMPVSGWAAPASGEEAEGASAGVVEDDGGAVGGVAGRTFFGVPIPTGGVALLGALAAFGFVGGLVLNLTPCVLPVIPIKVMTLSQHAGESRGRTIYLGAWMFMGVTLFWAALSLPVIFLAGFTDPSRLFGYWWFTIGVGLIVAVMSLGLMGLFNISLPQKTYMLNPKADNAWGSFLFGVMTAVLGLPCFGFVAGALVPAAAQGGPGFSVALFTSMGLGMAAPYLVFAAFPGLLKLLPRTGPVSDLVKQVMGLLLLAAGAYFLISGLNALFKTYPFLTEDVQWTVGTGIAAIAGVWLIVRTLAITKKPLNRTAGTAIGVLIVAASVFVGQDFVASAKSAYDERQAMIAEREGGATYFTTGWNEFMPGILEDIAADGKIAVVDFTADWCINCKALEKAVLDVDPVREELRADDTVKVKVDLTGSNPAGEALLRSFGREGIPALAVVGPGDGAPWVAGAYTRDDVMRAIAAARGEAQTGEADGGSDGAAVSDAG